MYSKYFPQVTLQKKKKRGGFSAILYLQFHDVFVDILDVLRTKLRVVAVHYINVLKLHAGQLLSHHLHLLHLGRLLLDGLFGGGDVHSVREACIACDMDRHRWLASKFLGREKVGFRDSPYQYLYVGTMSCTNTVVVL